MGKKKKDKKKSCDRERYVSTSLTDLFTPGKGPSIGFFGRSNITIIRQDNRQTDSLKAEFTV